MRDTVRGLGCKFLIGVLKLEASAEVGWRSNKSSDESLVILSSSVSSCVCQKELTGDS